MIQVARKVKNFGAFYQRALGFHHDSVRDEPAPYPGVKTEFTKEMRFILPEEVSNIMEFNPIEVLSYYNTSMNL